MSRLKIALLLAAGALVAPLPASAQAVNVGTLSCEVAPSVGLILGSNQPVRCLYKARGRRAEVYTGAITRVGVDVGVRQGTVATWAVYAPGRLPRHALGGTYTGASSALAVGAGAGSTTALVGGPARAVTLQPVALQNVTGLSGALGVAGLTIQ